jgi:GT2 family glycosyltransferase
MSDRTGMRPAVQGKFIFVGSEKQYIRGVTYGTFRLDERGQEFHDPQVVEHDCALMTANGLNALRTYTVPPLWLLDAAQRHNLRVMVGLPWEQHVAFLDDKQRMRSIEERVRAGVRACAGHPAVLCYTIGNEIPAPMVRWYGPHRVERFLERLYWSAKAVDPEGLVTYVNYPSTEYLQLPFVDLVCFNVYLESRHKLEEYLARLHNIGGDRPLIIAELGLDSRRHGEQTQAQTLDWQIRSAFAAGCAGAFVFAWTDQWCRGGSAIEDWDFGLTDRERRPKRALAAVRQAFAAVPFPPDMPSPRISVVVCTHNGQRTIGDCLAALHNLVYPNCEVIIVDDGSTDLTAALVRKSGFRVISTENQGLSHARNVGMHAATGEIIAYLDDDAFPDPHWLNYIAATFQSTEHAGVGGPNLPPPGDGPLAECVANAPGGPMHVLLSDREAEHIPGCNMAFRTGRLRAIGGFDPQFRIAGDDVDVCWRLQQQGWTLGYCPAAVVWHHRRNSVRAYLRQQKNYARAEALLEKKWPDKYNAVGHLTWHGRLYHAGLARMLGRHTRRIQYGMWGGALFQSVYQLAPGTLATLVSMPEWYLLIAALAVLSLLGMLWTPLLLSLIPFTLAVAALLAQAALRTAVAPFRSAPSSRLAQCKWRGLTALLHVLQPLARLWGRLSYGLSPWRWRGMCGHALPRVQTATLWSEYWRPPAERLQSLEKALRQVGTCVRRGGDFDRWDLEIQGGLFGRVRMLMAIEEHGAGKQLVRLRAWPVCAMLGVALPLLMGLLAVRAALDQAWTASVILTGGTVLLALRTLLECSLALAAVRHVLEHLKEGGG